MADLKHYIIAFTDNKGNAKIHDGWIDIQALEKVAGMDDVDDDPDGDIKAFLLCDYFSMDKVEDALSLDCFEGAILKEAQARPVEQQEVGREGGLILNRAIRRWDIEEGTVDPLPNEPVYDLTIKGEGSQIYIDILPAGLPTPEENESMPQLSLFIEINGGLPCVHIHGDVYGDMIQTIYGTSDGEIIVRPADGDCQDCLHVDSSYEPDPVEVANEIQSIKEENARQNAEQTMPTEK